VLKKTRGRSHVGGKTIAIKQPVGQELVASSLKKSVGAINPESEGLHLK
jgi:hypothetical protein